MEAQDIYDTVFEAVSQAFAEHAGGEHLRLARRMVEGRVVFEDGEGRVVKEIPTGALFKKVTAVRERLRVLEQKLNNHSALSQTERAELQGYISRCYGSLTTFNFLFRDDEDRFRGSGG